MSRSSTEMQKSDFLQVKITMHGHATTRFSDNDMVLLCTQNPGRDVSEVTCSLRCQDSICLGETCQVVHFLARVFQTGHQCMGPAHLACSALEELESPFTSPEPDPLVPCQPMRSWQCEPGKVAAAGAGLRQNAYPSPAARTGLLPDHR